MEVAQETLETEDFCDIDNDHEKTKVTDFKGRNFSNDFFMIEYGLYG